MQIDEIDIKQEVQSHYDIFRQGGTETIDWTYKNWF